MKQEIKSQIISYSIGFILSIILTFASYMLVMFHITSYHETISHEFLIPAILLFAFVQCTIQLFFFLHLGKKSLWSLTIFFSTVFLVALIIVGSIWIMSHLNYNMTPKQINQYVQNQQGGF